MRNSLSSTQDVSLPRWSLTGSRRQAIAWCGAAFVVYALFALALYWKVWSSHPSNVVIGGGDADLESWFLGVVAHGLANGNLSFSTTLANHPYGVNLLDNTSIIALGILSAPLTLAFGAIFSFNFLISASLVLSALSAYALIRRFSAFYPVALIGGLIYGFSQYMVTESSDAHLHLSFAALYPLFFLLLHDALVRCPTRYIRNGLYLALIIIAQYFISSEMLFALLVVTVGVLIVVAAVGRNQLRERIVSFVKSSFIALGGAIVVLAYPIWFSMKGTGHIVGPIMPVSQAYRADVAGLVLPDSVLRFHLSSHLLSVAQNFANGPAENGSYLGIPLLVVLVAGIIFLWRRPMVLVLAIGGAWAFLFSLGGALNLYKTPQIGNANQAIGRIPLPERIFDRIGTLHNMIPARFSVFVDLAAAVLLAIVIENLALYLARRLHNKRSSLIGAGVATLVALIAWLPLIPVFPLESAATVGAPAYFTASGVKAIAPTSVTMLFPYPSANAPQAQAWDSLTGDRFAMLGGYFLVPEKNGFIDDAGVAGYTRTTPLAAWCTRVQANEFEKGTPALRASLRATLRRSGVDNVIAVPQAASSPENALGALEWLLGAPSNATGGTVDWYHVQAHLSH